MKKRFLPGVLWMGDFDIILTFKKKQNMMQAAKKCGELFSCDAKTPEAATSGVFLFVTVNYSVQAVAAYLSLSSHLHMQQLTTPAMTEIRKLVNTSPIGIHLLSAGGSAAQVLYHISSLYRIIFMFYLYSIHLAYSIYCW